MCARERDQVLGLAFVEPAPRHRNTHGRSRFDVSGGSPGWRQVVDEHRGHEPLESRPLLFVYTPVGKHNLQRVRRGLDGDRTDLPGAHQVCVVGKHFLDEAELVVTVGEAVMDVEGRLRLSVANGQPELNQRLALVEVYGGLSAAGSSSSTTSIPGWTRSSTTI